MKEKREKTIRDYLYEEESNKTLTAKDIVSRIDFSTPQVKPQVRRKKKSKLKVALVCLSYILITFFTSIITYSVVIDKNNSVIANEFLLSQSNVYNQSYFQNDIIPVTICKYQQLAHLDNHRFHDAFLQLSS